MENENTYQVRDFYIATVLLASKQLHLHELQKITGKIVTFIFNDPKSVAEKIIREHWNRTNSIPSRDLIEAINELKTRIHNGV